jgi:type II secretory pathway pseudopilin PulG
MLAVTVVLAGCGGRTGDYRAASSISRDGFATSAWDLEELSGQEVKIWGFVDHGNIRGDRSAKAILGEWWSGDGPSATSWSFNLKADEDDPVGHSFSVHVPNGAEREALLRAFAADARSHRPTRVFVKGTLHTFDAPTNAATQTGLYMELRSSRDILLEPPE